MGFREDLYILEVKLQLLGREITSVANTAASEAWSHAVSAFNSIKSRVAKTYGTEEPHKSGFAWMPLIGLLCTVLPYLIELLKNRLATKTAISDDDKTKLSRIRGDCEAISPICDQLGVPATPYDPTAAPDPDDVPSLFSMAANPSDDMRTRLSGLLDRIVGAPRMFVGSDEKNVAKAVLVVLPTVPQEIVDQIASAYNQL